MSKQNIDYERNQHFLKASPFFLWDFPREFTSAFPITNLQFLVYFTESFDEEIDPNVKDLTVTYGFDKKQNIPGKFLIKIVKKKKVEDVQLPDGSGTVVLPLVIKDVHGNKAKLSIWPTML